MYRFGHGGVLTRKGVVFIAHLIYIRRSVGRGLNRRLHFVHAVLPVAAGQHPPNSGDLALLLLLVER